VSSCIPAFVTDRAQQRLGAIRRLGFRQAALLVDPQDIARWIAEMCEYFLTLRIRRLDDGTTGGLKRSDGPIQRLALGSIPEARAMTNDFLHIGMTLVTTLALVRLAGRRT